MLRFLWVFSPSYMNIILFYFFKWKIWKKFGWGEHQKNHSISGLAILFATLAMSACSMCWLWDQGRPEKQAYNVGVHTMESLQLWNDGKASLHFHREKMTDSMVNFHIFCTEINKRCIWEWNQTFLLFIIFAFVQFPSIYLCFVLEKLYYIVRCDELVAFAGRHFQVLFLIPSSKLTPYKIQIDYNYATQNFCHMWALVCYFLGIVGSVS